MRFENGFPFAIQLTSQLISSREYRFLLEILCILAYYVIIQLLLCSMGFNVPIWKQRIGYIIFALKHFVIPHLLPEIIKAKKFYGIFFCFLGDLEAE